MMLGALWVRTVELDQSIVTFHATRHYRSAVLARACYADRATDLPEWARAVADAGRSMQPAGELPLMEWAACGAYLALGREDVTIPRALAVVIWVAGAMPVWLLAQRLASPAAGLVAVALHLFLPYGIIASRNFQPDPLMTLSSLWALVALLRHYDRPTRARLLAAALLVAIAGLVKPMSIFLTIPAALVLSRFALAGLVLPGLYYGYQSVFGTLARDQMNLRFVPELIPTAFFWKGLMNMVARVETLPLFGLALLGTAVATAPAARRLLAALFGGYLVFAVGFTYHMPTHDYYHLPYISIVSIGVAALLARLEMRLSDFATPGLRMVVATTMCVIIAATGAAAAWPRLSVSGAEDLERMYEEIGAAAQHDTRVLFLDEAYGYALMYHAQIAGDAWPNLDDLQAERLGGAAAIDAEARFERDFADYGPNYFVVTDLGSLRAQADLQAMLARRAEPVAVTPRYHVYRLPAAAPPP